MEECVEKIVIDNQGLVYNVAKKYFGLFMSVNYEYVDDLIQEGEIGLMNAAINFDEYKGCKFSTYASVSIYRMMLSYIEKVIADIKKNELHFESEVLQSESGKVRIHDVIGKEDNIEFEFIDPYVIKRLEGLNIKDIIFMRADGLTFEEIGQKYNCTKQNIDLKIKRCKGRLMADKKFMEALGVVD